MSRATLKHVGLALIVGGVVLSASGIGAFSTVTADRRVFVDVGERSTSYLGISLSEPTVTANGTSGTRGVGTDVARSRGTQAGATVAVGSIRNYFQTEIYIELTIVSGTGPGRSAVSDVYVKKDPPLEPGTSTALIATVDCESESRSVETVTIRFEATGTDTRVKTTRKVPITCVNKTSPSAPSNSSRLVSPPRQMNTGSA